MFCNNCGQALPDWASYCLACGERIKNDMPSEMVFPDAEFFLNDDSYNSWIASVGKTGIKVPEVGDEIDFGVKDGESIRWKVLQIKDNEALILSVDKVSSKPYHRVGGEITWENCSLRGWLNNDFAKNCFTKMERTVFSPSRLVNQDNPKYQTPGGKVTTDNIFLLSLEEAGTVFQSNLACADSSWWWLRSPGEVSSNAAYVNSDGSIISFGLNVNYTCGVRPAMWIDLDSYMSTVKGSRDVVKAAAVNTADLLKRADVLLAEGSFTKAMSTCFTVADSDPFNGQAYLYMLMADLGCKNLEELAAQTEPFDDNQFYKKVMQCGDDDLKVKLSGYNKAIKSGKTIKLKKLKAGEEIEFGKSEGTPIRWIVLKATEDKALIISCKRVDDQPYNISDENVTWSECSLRNWLNADFFGKCFSSVEKSRIIPTKLENKDNPKHKTSGGLPTIDKIFLLSLDEVTTLFEDNKARANGSWWWLRTPGSNPYYAAQVDGRGWILPDGRNVSNNDGVRPAMWIKVGI